MYIHTRIFKYHFLLNLSFFSFSNFCFAGCEKHREMQVPFRCYHPLPLSHTHTN